MGGLRVIGAGGEIPALHERRVGVGSRAEILTGLSAKERMLVSAIVTALEGMAPVEHGQIPASATVLLRAFQDATGVDYVGCEWDV